jgi:PHD/YefM family antitoxin component YafN of YafNO toxin-antitoxin module
MNMKFHEPGGGVISLRDIHSLSEFQRNARAHVEHLRRTGRPEVLTVHGEAELVIQNAEAYQKLLDVVANAASIIGLQRGLQGMHDGTGEDVDVAFASLERELGIVGQV